MIKEYNCKTHEITEREMTAEEIELQNIVFEEPIPNSLTSRQLRMQLVLMGVDLSIIDSVIDSLPEPQKSLAKINWEYAGTFERDNGMMQEMIPLLGFSEEQINTIFTEGSKL